MNSNSIIEVRNFKAAYKDDVIIDNISFEIKESEIFVILGSSGSGKSTLLKHLIGLYYPVSGEIFIEGDNIAGAYGEEKNKILRKIGVAYQKGALFGSMTLLENLKLPLEEFSSLPEEAMNLISRMKLKIVGLEGSEHKMPSELSGGMQKRAALARAMVLDPKILFLDEPSAGLDPITSAGLDKLILNLNKNLGITFVIVTHELDSIFTIADRVLMLDRETKSIADIGDPRNLSKNSKNRWVRQFFNRQTEIVN
ncbi:MAG: ABC transporter ATP-binding protein [Thermodesulfobacteriota bacterium]